ncbi:phage terminase small subunit [Avibacterium sp. 20-129]|uniref:phage terminase small subunit n=1 Tax=Avibacterium sp. 20-129 TaxID=2911525 RepID=UPI00224838FE|nr:phage terminase small subunit [Avibacterium sp. 20-129]MCW9698143.1 phage terminase small subunit [Avibacterium sp. 20-129]
MRPTQAHVLKMTALEESAVQNPEESKKLSGYEKMLRILARHKKDLKLIQSNERKAVYKKEILPNYLPWIEGALSAGTGKQDNVLMTCLVWAIDCEEYQLALKIADYALFHDLRLPENFNRTLSTLLAEEFADKAKIAKNEQRPYLLAHLKRIAQMTDEQDMPDQSRARLYKEIGILSQDTDPENALAVLTRANELNPNCGVKTLVKRLQKQLNLS